MRYHQRLLVKTYNLLKSKGYNCTYMQLAQMPVELLEKAYQTVNYTFVKTN